VRKLVGAHRGHAVYAGGDDVLALVPLPNAIPCAKALAEAFRNAMQGPAGALDLQADESPTLSVGLGIGHLMEPMSALRARADAAEHDAKGSRLPEREQRNALAIRLGIRSGGEHCWRTRWTDPDGKQPDALADMQRLAEAFHDGKLPSRVAFDLREIDRRLAWLDADPDCVDQAAGMRAAEVARLLDRASGEAGSAPVPDELRRQLIKQAEAMALASLADWLIIARWLSARSAGDVGEQ
jgi:CRISPR-associated protein Cmr2